MLQAVVLGIVQGITEFLPISSDGHLILVPSLLGWGRFGLGFDVMLHFGTLLATALYFRRDLTELVLAAFSRSPERAEKRRLAWLIVAATIPSVIVVLALESFIDSVEGRSVRAQIVISAYGLLVTTVLLGASELIAGWQHRRHVAEPVAEKLSWAKGLTIGLAQGFAALPGVSRSGITIASGQSLGMRRDEAARFSFLMSIPIIAAATAKKGLDLLGGEGSLPPLPVTLTAVVVTTIVGYGAIWFLLPFVRKHSLWWFAAYTGIAGVVLLVRYGVTF